MLSDEDWFEKRILPTSIESKQKESIIMNEHSESLPCPEPEHNIIFNRLPELSWERELAKDSAQKLSDYAVCEAQLAIHWYLSKKRSKKIGAQFLRLFAIVAAAFAGLIPLLAQIAPYNHIPQIAPAWASVALVLAATAVGLDRFFGFSSAWMRFLVTEMQIRSALHDFLFDWEFHRVRLEGTTPDRENVQAMIQRCKEFLGQINDILKNEMDEWVKEFRQNLAEIDKATKAKTQVVSLGAINVNISNGNQCDGGWELSIDDRAPTRRQGKTAAVRDLGAGQHTARVTGTIEGKVLQAEAAFTAVSGRTGDLSLTLA